MKILMLGFLLAFSSLACANAFVLQNPAGSTEGSFLVKKYGNVEIPSQLKMSRPSLRQVEVIISYPLMMGQFELSCRYQSSKASNKAMFKECLDPNGNVYIDSVDVLKRFPAYLYPDLEIKMKVSQKMVIKAIHQTYVWAELAETFTLKNKFNSKETVFSVEQNGWITIPSELKMNLPATKKVEAKIYYNLNETGYEFSCRFEALAGSRKAVFKDCTNSEGSILINSSSDLQNAYFPIDLGTKIKMTLNRKVVLKATHKVDWK